MILLVSQIIRTNRKQTDKLANKPASVIYRKFSKKVETQMWKEFLAYCSLFEQLCSRSRTMFYLIYRYGIVFNLHTTILRK